MAFNFPILDSNGNPATTVSNFDDMFIQKDYWVTTGLYVSGLNTNGQLGLSDVVHRSSPVQLGSLTSWKSISSGKAHSVALKTDGTLWVWGYNNHFQLGNAASEDKSSPIQIGSLTNWKLLSSCCYQNTACIKTDGTLWTWGRPDYGTLGHGDTLTRSSPVQVGNVTNWKQISVGVFQMHAIKTDGTLWAWGYNGYGNLGVGDITNRSTPVQVGDATNWRFVDSSGFSSAFIKTDGTLWACGRNDTGQLGLKDATAKSTPVQVGSLTNWKLVFSGQYTTFAVKTDGTLWAWGKNTSGQLGLRDTTNRSSPSQVGNLTNWKLVSCGVYTSYSVALKTDGTLWSWGSNASGQLGVGDGTVRSSPVQVGTLTNWKTLSAGYSHWLAIQEDSLI